MKTIILLDRIEVEVPLTDCKRASRQRLGAFSSFEAADAWLQTQTPGEWPRNIAVSRQQFGFFEATEFALNEDDCQGRRRILAPDGTVRGEVPDWQKDFPPWTGEASDCRFAAGQIVGFIQWDRFRWGIVINGRWHARRGGEWLVDMATDSHCHPHGCELFSVPQAVPRATRTALQACLRKAKHEGILGV